LCELLSSEKKKFYQREWLQPANLDLQRQGSHSSRLTLALAFPRITQKAFQPQLRSSNCPVPAE
jgi:hypothetical protein